ncbi:MAG: sensor histidine kinase [Ruminiclostridium sp.]|nr:sensor histidine kinase [Ruminiclostridium sp.]
MKFFFDFIRSRIVTLVCVITAAVIFTVILSLYDLPTEPVLYALLLSVAAIVAIGVFSFIKAYRKHNILVRLVNEITVTADNLPKAVSTDDKDYSRLITILSDHCISLKEKSAESLRATNEYYTMWVHQIKTPISAMRLILQSSDSESNRRLSDELMKIEQYVDMALCYVRLESDSNDLVLKHHSLDDIVKKSVRRFSSQFIGKKLSLDYKELDTDVLTDEKWLSFIIGQLLSNAIKYTDKGSVSVYMKHDTDRKILCIADTGIGIDPADLPRIFDNGYTGLNGRYDMKASGIGLYICRCTADMLGITLTAKSEPGKGSVFMLDLTESNVRHE